MRVSVLSTQLCAQLKKIDFKIEIVSSVSLIDDCMILNTSNSNQIKIPVIAHTLDAKINQTDRPWHEVLETVELIDEQQVIICISEKKIQLILSY